MTDIDIENLRQWIGKVETFNDCVTPAPVAALRATLDMDEIVPQPGDLLPPMWQGLYFLPVCKQSDLNQNGHPKLGEFMPLIPLPRRMYAGSGMKFHHPLKIGDNITMTSTIIDVSFKEGRTGPLVFLKTQHEISNNKGLAITEERDIVYCEESGSGDAVPTSLPAQDNHTWIREMTADPVLLFRYSALTFNGHRIHFDHPYATEVEGYPGLVVHGPLIATLLLELLKQHLPDKQIRSFQFRAVKPIFDTAPFFLCGKPEEDGKTISLWAKDSAGVLCVVAGAMVD